MQIRFIWVGKTRSAPIRSMLEDYLSRLGHLAPCTVVELRDVQGRKGSRGMARRAAEGTQIRKALSPGSKK
ncbi:MAG: 23S rRNA (pseudouridine(1915)-N(3))-methyltransferase RlmH, partial [Acidobacteria bacterium]|nr:23S rRNA (pseudouridine(1915)-N(3))-methyltransferase RlmH [Acidobacteriota bacterium]